MTHDHDETPFRYDQVPYESHAYAESSPDRLATMARLFGMDPAPPERCRVLEIGCAAGGNIGPLAVLYPESTFVGFDLSQVQIEDGREFVEPLGLDNLELRHANVLDVDERWGTFDYILCHGIWSWVDDDVRRKILEVCHDRLAPQGVAYVSYNTYPGWHMRGMIRDMMLFHTDPFDDPETKVEQARALLEFLAKAHPEDATQPYAVLLKQEASILRQLTNSYLFHDHLSDTNDPVYFHEFMEAAIDQGLAYLSESSFRAMLPMHLPEHVREILDEIGSNIVKMEQYMDFVRNRTFRSTLLVHEDNELDRALDWRDMQPFWFACQGEWQGDELEVADTSEAVLRVSGQEMKTAEPIIKAAFDHLVGIWPHNLPFDELFAVARDRIGDARDEAEDREILGGNLLQCFANALVEVRSTPLPVADVSERPEAFAWARRQAEIGKLRLTNLRHTSVQVDQLLRRTVYLADGERDAAAMKAQLLEWVTEDKMTVSEQDGDAIEDPERLAAIFDQVLPEAIANCATTGLLIE